MMIRLTRDLLCILVLSFVSFGCTNCASLLKATDNQTAITANGSLSISTTAQIPTSVSTSVSFTKATSTSKQAEPSFQTSLTANAQTTTLLTPTTQNDKLATSIRPNTTTVNETLQAPEKRSASGLTRAESLIGFAVAGSVLLIVCGYFMISCGVKRYRRWQLDRLLLSIRGDDDGQDSSNLLVRGDREQLLNTRGDEEVYTHVPGNRNRNDRRIDTASTSSSSSGADASSTRRMPSFDTIGLRPSHSNSTGRDRDADCDLLVTERTGASGAANPLGSAFRRDRGEEIDDPILVLGDDLPPASYQRDESLI